MHASADKIEVLLKIRGGALEKAQAAMDAACFVTVNAAGDEHRFFLRAKAFRYQKIQRVAIGINLARRNCADFKLVSRF